MVGCMCQVNHLREIVVKLIQRVTTMAGAALFMVFSMSASALVEEGCLGGSNTICISETVFENLEGSGVQYSVTNNQELPIWAFGVSNSAHPEEVSAATALPGWRSMYVTQSDWDAGEVAFTFSMLVGPTPEIQGFHKVTPSTWYSGFDANGGSIDLAGVDFLAGVSDLEGILETLPEEVYLGSFASLFGTEESNVTLFWRGDIQQAVSLGVGETLSDFYLYNAEPESGFTTFAPGAIISTSVAAVPEPATYVMFLAGLGLLGFAHRKQQA